MKSAPEEVEVPKSLPEKMFTMSHRNSQELQERFPPEVTSKLPVFKGGKKVDDVDFVAWHHYSRRLNELFPLGWGVTISQITTVGDTILMVVDVKIGSYTYCGTGSADVEKRDWGGAHAEAFSQGFRRACAQPGLGLYFYGMEEMDAVAKKALVEDMEKSGLMGEEKAALYGDDPPADPEDEVEQGVPEPAADAPPSQSQLARLHELAETNIFTEASLDEYRANIKAHYTRNGVGLEIRRMKAEYRAVTGEEFVSLT